MHGHHGAIRNNHGQPGDAEPSLGPLGWAALTAMIYLPAAATVVLFVVGGIICRHGNVPIWNRLLGPLAMIAFGWTFLGAGIWDFFSHESTDLLKTGPQDGRSKMARRADALLPVLFGALFMAIGIWILFEGGIKTAGETAGRVNPVWIRTSYVDASILQMLHTVHTVTSSSSKPHEL